MELLQSICHTLSCIVSMFSHSIKKGQDMFTQIFSILATEWEKGISSFSYHSATHSIIHQAIRYCRRFLFVWMFNSGLLISYCVRITLYPILQFSTGLITDFMNFIDTIPIIQLCLLATSLFLLKLKEGLNKETC